MRTTIAAVLLSVVIAMSAISCSGGSATPVSAGQPAEAALTAPTVVAAAAVAASTAPAAAQTALEPTAPELEAMPAAMVQPVITPRAIAAAASLPTATPPSVTPAPATDAAAEPAPVSWPPLFETMTLAGKSFEPHQIHGNAGQQVTVRLTATDTTHTFTIAWLGVDVSVAKGETKTVSFVVPEPGITSFYCRIHGSEKDGMFGQLVFH